MSLIHLPNTYLHLRRLREIVSTLMRHGFSHILNRMGLFEHVPGLGAPKVRFPFGHEGEADAQVTVPERLTQVLQELGATFIKFGQLLATRPDLIPADYIQAFRRLQDQVDPIPPAEIRAVVETYLKRPIDEAFLSWEDTPVASGSIGQVHHATLLDGTRVVVKVKRPGTDRRVRQDIELLTFLASMVEKHVEELRVLRPRMVVEEFGRVMERELDFVGEASFTELFSKTFSDVEEVRAPAVYWDYVTHDTLVLERIEGLRLTQRDALDRRGYNKPQLARVLSDCFLSQYFVHGIFHADPHPGNIFVPRPGQIALIDFGQVGRISSDLRQQLAASLVALSQGDTDFIVDIYAEIGVFTEETDLREFKAEFSTLMNRYFGVPVDRLDIGQAFQEAISVARNNGLLLPRDFVLLVKSFITVFGVINELDPHFRINEAVQPFLRQLFLKTFAPGALSKRMGFYAYRVYSILRRLPEDARDLLEKARTGKTRIIFHHEGLEQLSDQLERSSNRLTLGMLVSAILMGSSIVLVSGAQLGSLPLPMVNMELQVSMLISGIGFTTAMAIGMWLAWGILRKRKL